jgi:adenine-specific DNA-methyltransferase
MDKLKMETPDLTQANIEKLAALFPACVTEARGEDGKLKKAVNFELLRQMLSDVVLEGDESYEFTWVGKKAAIVEANRPIRKTLRPCPAESVDWDTTENLYIEGDNLEVLKLLQESYLGKVKMIYIDPPYNTGNDFIYRDDFAMSGEEYSEESGQVDEETGDRLFKNTDSNGRFHSDWCSMIYSRLMLARNLLSDDGVVFISIDDNECSTMKLLCDEVFGAVNFIAQLVWEKKKKGSFLSNSITNIKEYILVYCKSVTLFEGLIGEINNNTETYPCINAVNKRELRTIPAGIESKYKEPNFFMPKGSEISDTTMSIILHSDLVIKNRILAQELILEGNWRYSQEAMTQYATKKELYITRDLYLRRIVNDTRYKTLKDLLSRVGNNSDLSYKATIDLTNLNSSGWGSNEDADEELRLIFGIQKILDYPKPLRLIEKLLASYRNATNSIVLDFFSGSATTAHAVMQLNAEDGGHRKFIMVQLSEPCDEKSEAYKAGYKNICEIGKERIRRAGKKIVEEQAHLLNAVKSGAFQRGEVHAEFTTSPKAQKAQDEIKRNLDTGFRVFKLADTNMTDVYYSAGEYTQNLLDQLVSNIKPDRTDLDLLFGCLLEWGLPLSMPYTSEQIEGCTVHTYNDGDLIACFDENIPDTVIKEIAKRQPLRAVFRDSSFADSPAKINVGEIFKMLAPDTKVKVL